MNVLTQHRIEQTVTPDRALERAESAAGIVLNLGDVAMRFSRVERVPRYADGRRESDVEHSFMLGLVAPELAACLELDLDIAKVYQYAAVHDLIELKTGDVATFLLDHGEIESKEETERLALRELLDELPPYTAAILEAYEQQADIESRFVRMVDKLLPIVVDIIGDGVRVMREDYGVTGSEQLRQCHEQLHRRIGERFGEEFPELLEVQASLMMMFEEMATDEFAKVA